MAGDVRGPDCTPVADRLARYIDRGAACWLWFGHTEQGFPRLWTGGTQGRTVNAQRLMYQLHVGAIPRGYRIGQRCENRLCLNPQHLVAHPRYPDLRKRAAKRIIQ